MLFKRYFRVGCVISALCVVQHEHSATVRKKIEYMAYKKNTTRNNSQHILLQIVYIYFIFTCTIAKRVYILLYVCIYE